MAHFVPRAGWSRNDFSVSANGRAMKPPVHDVIHSTRPVVHTTTSPFSNPPPGRCRPILQSCARTVPPGVSPRRPGRSNPRKRVGKRSDTLFSNSQAMIGERMRTNRHPSWASSHHRGRMERGRYSNNMAWRSTRGIHLDWQLSSTGGVHLVSRVLVSPTHAKRIIECSRRNWSDTRSSSAYPSQGCSDPIFSLIRVLRLRSESGCPPWESR
jgi:hypothetical protein